MGGGEIGYVQDAFSSNWMSTVGPNIDGLERSFSELVGWPSVALASGTAALHLALRLVGVVPGDEVVTQSLTFVASVNPILYDHARPVLMDSERTTWNLDPKLLGGFLEERSRTGRMPRAVVVVHLFGQPARLSEIALVCRHHGVALIEDAAESLGALYRGRHPGTFGDVGIYSFNGNKMITGTTGGMLVAANPDRVSRIRHWSTQARDPDPAGLGNYVHTQVGYNYRMSNVVAGIVRGQLEVLPLRVRQRRAVFERYRTAFAGISGLEPQPDPPGSTSDPGLSGELPEGTIHSRWLSCFLVDAARFGRSAGELIRWLDAANIESRPVWRPMHLQPLFTGCEVVGGAVAEDLNARGICLPSSSSLTEADQDFVIETVLKAAR